MEINVKQTEEQNLVNLINKADNPAVKYTPLDFVFGKPEAIVGVAQDNPDVHNTRITITAAPNSGRKGSETKTYHRVNLAKQWEILNLPNSIQYLGDVNDKAALTRRIQEYMEYRTESVVLSARVAPNGQHEITLTPIPDSICYNAGVTFMVRGDDVQPQPKPIVEPKQPALLWSEADKVLIGQSGDTDVTTELLFQWELKAGGVGSVTARKENGVWSVETGTNSDLVTVQNSSLGIFHISGAKQPSSAKVTARSNDPRASAKITTAEVPAEQIVPPPYVPRKADAATHEETTVDYMVFKAEGNVDTVEVSCTDNDSVARVSKLKRIATGGYTVAEGLPDRVIVDATSPVFKLRSVNIQDNSQVTVTTATADTRDEKTSITADFHRVAPPKPKASHAPTIADVKNDTYFNRFDVVTKPAAENVKYTVTYTLRANGKTNTITLRKDTNDGSWSADGKLPGALIFNPSAGSININRRYLKHGSDVIAVGYDDTEAGYPGAEARMSNIDSGSLPDTDNGPSAPSFSITSSEIVAEQLPNAYKHTFTGKRANGEAFKFVVAESSNVYEWEVLERENVPEEAARLVKDGSGISSTYHISFKAEHFKPASRLTVISEARNPAYDPIKKEVYFREDSEHPRPRVSAAPATIEIKDGYVVEVTPADDAKTVGIDMNLTRSQYWEWSYPPTGAINREDVTKNLKDGATNLNVQLWKDKNGVWQHSEEPYSTEYRAPYPQGMEITKVGEKTIRLRHLVPGDSFVSMSVHVTSKKDADEEEYNIVPTEQTESHTYPAPRYTVTAPTITDNKGELRVTYPAAWEDWKHTNRIEITVKKANGEEQLFALVHGVEVNTYRYHYLRDDPYANNLPQGVEYINEEDTFGLVFSAGFTEPGSDYTVNVLPTETRGTGYNVTRKLKHDVKPNADKARIDTSDDEKINIHPGDNNTKLTITYVSETDGNQIAIVEKDTEGNWKLNEDNAQTVKNTWSVESNVISAAKAAFKDNSKLTVVSNVEGYADVTVEAQLGVKYVPTTADVPTLKSVNGNITVEPGQNNRTLELEFEHTKLGKVKVEAHEESGNWDLNGNTEGVNIDRTTGKVTVADNVTVAGSRAIVIAKTGDRRDTPARAEIEVAAFTTPDADAPVVTTVEGAVSISAGLNNAKLTIKHTSENGTEQTTILVKNESGQWEVETGDVANVTVETTGVIKVSDEGAKDGSEMIVIAETKEPRANKATVTVTVSTKMVPTGPVSFDYDVDNVTVTPLDEHTRVVLRIPNKEAGQEAVSVTLTREQAGDWTSSDDSLVTVNGGNFTFARSAFGAGTLNYTATATGKTDYNGTWTIPERRTVKADTISISKLAEGIGLVLTPGANNGTIDFMIRPTHEKVTKDTYESGDLVSGDAFERSKLTFTKEEGVWTTQANERYTVVIGQDNIQIKLKDNSATVVGDNQFTLTVDEVNVTPALTDKRNEVAESIHPEFTPFVFTQTLTLPVNTVISTDGDLNYAIGKFDAVRLVKAYHLTGTTVSEEAVNLSVKREGDEGSYSWKVTSDVETNGLVTVADKGEGHFELAVAKGFLKPESGYTLIVKSATPAAEDKTLTGTVAALKVIPQATPISVTVAPDGDKTKVTIQPGDETSGYVVQFTDRSGKENKFIWDKEAATDDFGFDASIGQGAVLNVVRQGFATLNKETGVVTFDLDKVVTAEAGEFSVTSKEKGKRDITVAVNYPATERKASNEASMQYDNTTLTVGPIKAKSFKVEGKLIGKPFTSTYEWDETNKRFVQKDGTEIANNGSYILDVSNGEEGFSFKVLGSALRNPQDDQEYFQLSVITNDDPVLHNVERELYYTNATVASSVNSFEKKSSNAVVSLSFAEHDSLKEDGVFVRVNNGGNHMEVDYERRNGDNAKAVFTRVVSTGPWVAASTNVDPSEADVDGIFIKQRYLKRPSTVQAAVYTGPRETYNPVTDSVEVPPAVHATAGEAVISEAGKKVQVQLVEPLNKVTISWDNGDGKKEVSLEKPFNISGKGEYLEAVAGNLITFKEDVVKEEIEVTAVTSTGKVDDIDSTVVYRTKYRPKPVGTPSVVDNNGTAVVTASDINNVKMVITYQSEEYGLSELTYVKGESGWRFDHATAANGVYDESKHVTLNAGNAQVTIAEDDVMDLTRVKAVVYGKRDEDGSQTAETEIGRKISTASTPQLTQQDGVVTLTLPKDNNIQKVVLVYKAPAAIAGEFENAQVTFRRTADTWDGFTEVPAPMTGKAVITKDETEQTVSLVMQPECFFPNTEMTATAHTKHDWDRTAKATVNVGEKPYERKPVVAATLRTLNGDMGISVLGNQYAKSADISYYPLGETVAKTFTVRLNENGKLEYAADAQIPLGMFIDKSNNIYIPAYGLEPETKVTVVTHNADERDGTATAEERVSTYTPKELERPEVNDGNAVLGIKPKLDTKELKVKVHVEGPSPFEDGGELTVTGSYNLTTKRWSLTTDPRQPNTTVQIDELTGLIQIKQDIIQDKSVAVIEVTPIDSRDRGVRITKDLEVWEYPKVGDALVTWNEDKTKLFIDQANPDNVLYFDVKYASVADNAERTVQFARSKYRANLPYKAVTGNFGAFSDTNLPSGIEVDNDAEGRMGRRIVIDADELNMTHGGKAVIVTVRSHGPNPDKAATEVTYKVSKKAIVIFKDGLETPLKPILVREGEYLSLTPGDDDGATRVVTLEFVKKDNTVDRFAVRFDSTKGEWVTALGDKHIYSLDKATGKVLVKEAKLMNGTLASAYATNGQSGVALRMATAEITVVNNEAPQNATNEIEHKPHAAAVNLDNEGTSMIFPIEEDAATRLMEIDYYGPATVQGADPVEHTIQVQRLGEADRTPTRNWETIGENLETGVEFDPLHGVVKLPTEKVDPRNNIIRVTTRNVKEETSFGFKPGQGKATISSVDGAVDITIPDDGISSTATVYFTVYGDRGDTTVVSAYKEKATAKWKITANEYGVKVSEAGVIHIPHHTAQELSSVRVELFADAGGIKRGPFTGTVSKNRPDATPTRVEKLGNEIVYTPVKEDVEFMGYDFSYKDNEKNVQAVAIRYNRDTQTFTSSSSSDDVVIDNTTGIARIPTTKVANLTDTIVKTYNTQRWAKETAYRFTLEDAAHPIKELVTVKPAIMESYRGNLLAAPQSANVDRMSITFTTPAHAAVSGQG